MATAAPHRPGSWGPVEAPPPRRRRAWIWPLATLVLLAGLVLAVVWVAGTRYAPGTTVVGAPVRTELAAADAVRSTAAEVALRPVRFATSAGEVDTTAAELGIAVDEAGTLAPLQGATGVGAWARRFTDGPLRAPLRLTRPSPEALAEVVAGLEAEAVDGDVRVEAGEVVVVEPQAGVRVAPEAVAAALDRALAAVGDDPLPTWPSPLVVDVPAREVPPAVAQADIDAVVGDLEALEAATVEVVADGTVAAYDADGFEVTLPPDASSGAEAPHEDGAGPAQPAADADRVVLAGADLLGLVVVQRDVGAPEGERLRIATRPDATSGPLVDLLGRAARPPRLRMQVVDASPPPSREQDPTDVGARTGRVVGEPLTAGFEPNLAATVEAVLEAAREGEGEVAVAGIPRPAETATPADLGVVQAVSTFTTYFEAGQPRVRNIQRIAEIVDGTVIPPGAVYELNHAVGERTVERGFVEGGAILDGEFVTDVGGGVSQFATTFFNASWFAGVELVRFQPHSFYFDRYPAGREATINYPGVNLEIRNDTPSTILVDTQSTDTSVTVTFWSTPWWQVETVTGDRVPVDGGFRITVERDRVAPDGTADHDSYTTRYRVQ